MFLLTKNTKKSSSDLLKEQRNIEEQKKLADLFEKLIALPVCVQADTNYSDNREFWNIQSGLVLIEQSYQNQKSYRMFLGTHFSSVNLERMSQLFLVWSAAAKSLGLSEGLADRNDNKKQPCDFSSSVPIFSATPEDQGRGTEIVTMRH